MIKRTIIDYLEDIENSIKDIENFISGFDYKTFKKDRKTTNAVIRSIEVIGEAARKVPSEFRKKHKDIPWNQMAEMRNKMIHEYTGVDLETVWKTASSDIPNLKKKIKDLI